MKIPFVVLIVFLVLFNNSCGGDERDNSIEASCRKNCEKGDSCSEDGNVDECSSKCAENWQRNIEEGDILDTEECKDAFADWAECMSSLVCADYEKEGYECEEDDYEYECQCYDKLANMNSVCPVK